MQKQAQCPNCASFKVKRSVGESGVEKVGMVVAGFGLFLLVVGVFVWPLLLPGFVFAVLGYMVAWVSQLSQGVQPMKCRACGVHFNLTR